MKILVIPPSAFHQLERRVWEGTDHRPLYGTLFPAHGEERWGSDEYSWGAAAGFLSLLGQKSSELQLLAISHSTVHACGWFRYSYVHTFCSDITDLSVSCSGTQKRVHQPGHLGLVLTPFPPAPDHQVP